MNLEATDSPGLRGEEQGRQGFLQLDHGYFGISPKSLRSGKALPLRQSLDADGRAGIWSLRKTIRIKFRLDNRYCVSHELG